MRRQKKKAPTRSTKPEANEVVPGIHRIGPADTAKHFGGPEGEPDKESVKSSQDKEPSERPTSE